MINLGSLSKHRQASAAAFHRRVQERDVRRKIPPRDLEQKRQGGALCSGWGVRITKPLEALWGEGPFLPSFLSQGLFPFRWARKASCATAWTPPATGQRSRSVMHFAPTMGPSHKHMPLECLTKRLALMVPDNYALKMSGRGRSPARPRPDSTGKRQASLTGLQRIDFIGHSGSVSLLALPRDLGRCEDRSCRLVQRGGDLVDVVQADHGEDEAAGEKGEATASAGIGQPGAFLGSRQQQGENPGSGLGKWGKGEEGGRGEEGSLKSSQEEPVPKDRTTRAPHPAARHLPGGDADPVDEAGRKESQQEAEKNWEGKRGQGGAGRDGKHQALLCGLGETRGL